MNKFLRYTRKFFKWLWRGNSIGSYIAFIVFAFVLLKFIAFPLFLFTFGLNDVVAVLSSSMHHQAGVIDLTYNDWLSFNGYNENATNLWPFQNGLDIGDVVTVHPGEINVGDVVVYYHGRDMIIHRVVNKTSYNNETFITTKGDANPDSMNFEYNIPENLIVGKAGIKIPLLGWPRVLLYYLLGI